jgi:hypothetical protein
MQAVAPTAVTNDPGAQAAHALELVAPDRPLK